MYTASIYHSNKYAYYVWIEWTRVYDCEQCHMFYSIVITLRLSLSLYILYLDIIFSANGKKPYRNVTWYASIEFVISMLINNTSFFPEQIIQFDWLSLIWKLFSGLKKNLWVILWLFFAKCVIFVPIRNPRCQDS